MAMKIDTGDGEKARRSDVFHAVPSCIEVDWHLNGRSDHVPDADVAALAADMVKNGQIQPITVRRLANKKIKAVAGYTRLKAALLIERDDPKFRIAARVIEVNDEEAFLVNIRENLIRNNTTPVDNAVNMRRLMENYAYSKAQVAELFRLSPTAVDNTLKLLSLPAKVRARVSAGTLPASAAVRLVGLDDAAIEASVRQAEEEAAGDPASPVGGKVSNVTPVKVTTSQVAKAARERGVRVGRTLSDLRKVLGGREDPLSRMILDFLAGTVEPSELEIALDALTEGVEV